MAESTTTHVQQATALWHKAIGEQIDRWDAMLSEVGKLETKGFEQICSNVDEAARLAKESAAYANLLGAQWRKLAVDATRQALELFGGKGTI